MKKVSLCFVCIFLFIHIFNILLIINSYAQPQTVWEKRYADSSGHNVYFSDMMIDKKGNVYIAGYIAVGTDNDDILTLKYDCNGNLLWSKSYDGYYHDVDAPNAIAVDNSGNVIVAGYIGGTPGLQDYIAIKYDENGDSVWISRIGFRNDTLSQATSIAVDDSDNVYIVGYFDYDIWTGGCMLNKYNKDGVIQWTKYYGIGDNESHMSCNVITTKNKFVRVLYDGDVEIEYDLNGNQIWSKTYNEDTLSGIKLQIDKNDNSYIGGLAVRGTYRDYWFGLTKRDSSGNKQWIRTYHSMGDAYSSIPYDIAVDDSGNSYITGVSGQTGQMGWDYTTIKYNSNGDSVWVKRYNPATASDDWAFSVTADKEGNAYVTGKSNRYNLGYGYTTIKYASDGTQLWVKRYDGGYAYMNSEGKKILVDTNLNIYVSGNSNVTGTNEIATVKYSQTVGITKISSNVPDKSLLYQNYPNPFNPATNIKYQITNSKYITLKVYDLLGREVVILVNEKQNSGTYEVKFDGSNYSTGVYFYRLLADGNIIDTKKLVLIK
jgi:hypothetical protein